MSTPEDFNGLDENERFTRDPVAAELATLHQRILVDGAHWRVYLPGVEALAEQVSALAAQTQRQRSLAIHSREEEHVMADKVILDHEQLQPTPPSRKRSPLAGMRGVLAVAAAIVIVALFATLLYSFHAGQNTLGSSGPKHPTATSNANQAKPGQWTKIPGLTNTQGAPVIAPSDTHVVYEASGSQLRRSADDGATWQNLTIPGDFPSGDSYSWIDLFVSPLDANTIYAMASLTNPSGGAINCPTPDPFASVESSRPIAASNAHTPSIAFASQLGGVVPCEVQNISTDGGKTWRLLRFPFGGRLGSASADASIYNFYNSYSAAPQAQGQRLYSLAGQGPLAAGGGFRLATSMDGGATWQAADDTIQANGLSVCWYAAPPTGSTVYAVASTACNPEYGQAQSLWRSDDAGASWRRETMPTSKTVSGMASTGGAQPTLYVLTSPAQASTRGVNLTVTPTDVLASRDGGATWEAAPAQGIPTGQVAEGNVIVTLADGSALVPFTYLGNTPGTTTFYVWKANSGAWQPLASLSANGIVSLLALPNGESAQDTIWLTTPDRQDPSQTTYTTQQYAQ